MKILHDLDTSQNPPVLREIISDNFFDVYDYDSNDQQQNTVVKQNNVQPIQGTVQEIDTPVIAQLFTIPPRGRTETWRNIQRRLFQYYRGEPTGIMVTHNDTITVYVQGNRYLRASIGTLGIPGLPNEMFTLNPGINSIRRNNANSTGLLYLINEDNNSPITVEVSGGHTNPLFILGKHNQRDWQAMLNQHPNTSFVELKGDRCLIVISRQSAVRYLTADSAGDFNGNPAILLESIDEACYFQDEVSGIAEFMPMPHKQDPHYECFVESNNTTWMAASDFTTRYNPSAINRLLRSFVSNGWGPWHEMGHQRQMPSWFWNRNLLVEVTVNIYSLYTQRAFGNPSNMEFWNHWDNRVFPFVNRTGSKNFDTDSGLGNDGRLGMFWQLDLAFGRNFYPKLHQMYRELLDSQLPASNSGEPSKQMFIYMASKAANRNLRPFFERWGITPSAETINRINAYPALERQIWLGRDNAPIIEYLIPGIEAPTNIRSTHATNDTISLTWDQPESIWGHLAYEIFRDGVSVGITQTTSYTDTGLVGGMTYDYSAKAINLKDQVSPLSNSVPLQTIGSGTTPPPTPEIPASGLTFRVTGEGNNRQNIIVTNRTGTNIPSGWSIQFNYAGGDPALEWPATWVRGRDGNVSTTVNNPLNVNGTVTIPMGVSANTRISNLSVNNVTAIRET